MSLAAAFAEVLGEGLGALGVQVDGAGLGRLRVYAERLLFWNRKMNLTAVTAPAEVAELHLVDSLALLRTLGGAGSVLDIGSGAGLPGVALACARPELAVTCCDAVAKKVAFVKAVTAELDLRVAARAVKAAGRPEAEGLPRCEAVVSRAFADPERWVALGVSYLAEGGALFVMMGREEPEGALGRVVGLEVASVDRFTLPRSGARRAIARLVRRRG